MIDPAKVAIAVRERWLDHVIADGCPVLLVHPKALQTGLNSLTAFHTAIRTRGRTTTRAPRHLALRSGMGDRIPPRGADVAGAAGRARPRVALESAGAGARQALTILTKVNIPRR